MDVRSSQLIVVTFMVFAAIVSLVAYWGFRHTVREAAQLEAAWEESEAESPGQPSGRSGARPLGSNPRQRDPAHEEAGTIKRLRELLDRRTETLQKQNHELTVAKAVYAKTKAEYDQLVLDYERLRQQNEWQLASAVSEVLQNPVRDDSVTPSAANADNTSAATRSGGAAAAAADVTQDPETELAEAEWELTQSRARVAELELSLLRELGRSAKATETIVATGAAAVPVLITALSDPEPELRRWSANMLGRIGPDAIDAIDSLRQLLRDTDADVARAARLALDQIEGRL